MKNKKYKKDKMTTFKIIGFLNLQENDTEQYKLEVLHINGKLIMKCNVISTMTECNFEITIKGFRDLVEQRFIRSCRDYSQISVIIQRSEDYIFSEDEIMIENVDDPCIDVIFETFDIYLEMDAERNERLFKTLLIKNTNNDITKIFPNEVVDYILKWI